MSENRDVPMAEPHIPPERATVPNPHEIGIVSKDDFSSRRYWELGYINNRASAKVPFYKGFLITGSLIKGKPLDPQSAVDTDIDLVGIIDRDDLRNHWETLAQTDLVFREKVEKYQQIYGVKAYEMAAKEYVGDRIVNAAGGYGYRAEATAIILAETGEHSIAEIVNTIPEGEDDYLRMIRIATPFLHSAGKAMVRYRAAYAKHLQNLDPAAAEVEWQRVKQEITRWQKGYKNNIPQENIDFLISQIPQTAQEAIKRYEKPQASVQ